MTRLFTELRWLLVSILLSLITAIVPPDVHGVALLRFIRDWCAGQLNDHKPARTNARFRCAEAHIEGLLCLGCIPLGDCRQFIEASLSRSTQAEEEPRHETA
ncbi:hypothetical protein [Ferrovibrio xuzhouensis]|uniref:Secreted protein n=1 Tax=Ferrovibrio xuzhouensis TaxID=1576914 RepID=A0ABV7VB82_9PROT